MYDQRLRPLTDRYETSHGLPSLETHMATVVAGWWAESGGGKGSIDSGGESGVQPVVGLLAVAYIFFVGFTRFVPSERFCCRLYILPTSDQTLVVLQGTNGRRITIKCAPQGTLLKSFLSRGQRPGNTPCSRLDTPLCFECSTHVLLDLITHLVDFDRALYATE